MTLACGALMSWDTVNWYSGYGWRDGLTPVHRPVGDPALNWLRAHPEVTAIEGSYWDVYRLAFLSDRDVKAMPWPGEPDRFPEWSRGGRPRIWLVRPDFAGRARIEEARVRGAVELHRTAYLVILTWP